ncbi:arylsulfatase [Aeromicrobium sp. YIM 150415]|uniref:arylsulfatase n=1 Tax=Aeromicrobium sp. YIM 150415 TaxID=2803912 RepID=UPI00196687E8|nr:arylsulfatase [Aeromicrobium sp. YIM 150415]MBM9465597.1 arylsulfatase [Aeromicrobium sp. YIM 150415]
MSRTPFTPYDGFQGQVREAMADSVPAWPESTPPSPSRPNVVVMLADDLGFSDIGCYGSEIPTPHLDAFADEGIRYSNFRVTPLCSPTRAALLTGLNAHQAGVAFPTHVDPGFPGYASELLDDHPTMAEVFADNGYSTLMVGKWHLCREEDLGETGDRSSWPLQRGFDQYYGFLEALTNFHQPHRMIEGNSVVDVDEYPDDYYLTDDLTDRAERMIKEVRGADPDKPFFLYFAHGAVHAPHQAKREDIERHRGRYDEGWDVLRQRRLDRQIEQGIVPPGTTLPPRNGEAGHAVPAWDSLSQREKQVFARYMEVYAAMVDNMDQSVGRLRRLLKDLGELENTIFIFASDNGAARLTDKPGAALGPGATTTDTGTPSYFGYVQSAEDISSVDDPRLEDLDTLGSATSWPHYPRGWAMLGNTPFRLYKFSTLRGGQQSPLIVSWPQRFASRGSVVRGQYTHVTDVLPTLVDLIDLKVPDRGHEWAGVSFGETVDDGEVPSRHREQYTECVGNRSFYRDGWEASTVRKPMVPFDQDPWELFGPDDVTQSRDLSPEHPDKLRELIGGFDEAAWDNQVYPLDEGSGVKFLLRRPSEPPRPVRILPGTPTLERHHSSSLIAAAQWAVRIEWRPDPLAEGVLVSHGEQSGGYLLAIEEGRVRLYINDYGREDVITGREVPSTSPLLLEVETTPQRRWTMSVVAGGEHLLDADDLPAFKGFLPFDGIDVGICRRSPVSWDLYRRRGTFPFTGELVSVTYEPGELTEADRLERIEAARRQWSETQ